MESWAGGMPNHFMRRAIELSVENAKSGRGGPFGCVIVRDGKIIAEGANRVTSANDPTAHAEVVAIREACKVLGSFQLDGCEIYTSCEPCPMCMGAIYWARPARVFYACTHTDAAAFGFDDSFIYHEFQLPKGERQIPMNALMREEGLRAFEAWRDNPGKTAY